VIPTVSTQKATIWAAILLITLVGISLSLFIPLLSLAMERMQISATVSGLNSAIAGIGTFCIAPFVPRLAAHLGIRTVITGAILVAAATAIAFPLLPFPVWFLLRFLFGAAIGTLFVLSEYWISAAASEERRGITMGIYATMLSLGFASGPLLLGLTGTLGLLPYLAGAGIILLALLPLALGKELPPPVAHNGAGEALSMMTMVPVATLAALVFGAIETGGFALFPVYGLRNGLSEPNAALLISIIAAGNVVSQIPIGWLSDSMNRPQLLMVCALVGVLGCIAMPFALYDKPIFYTVLFIWGGFTGGLYTVGLAHLSASIAPDKLAEANAAFIMLYSLGLIAGPLIVGLGMDGLVQYGFGNHGLVVALGGMLSLYAVIAGFDMARNKG
jgi:MFS family permease